MIFGNYPATVDPKGRLKIPTAVRSYFEEAYGPDFFVTSIDGGQSVRVYPLSVWKEIAEKLASPPSFNKAKRKLADQTAYLGQTTRVDTQGRKPASAPERHLPDCSCPRADHERELERQREDDDSGDSAPARPESSDTEDRRRQEERLQTHVLQTAHRR